AEDVTVIGGTRMLLGPDRRPSTDLAPTFMAPKGLDPGTELLFELRIISPFGSQYDTLSVAIAAGDDQTAPLVRSTMIVPAETGVRIVLTTGQYFEADQLRSATAVIYSVEDSTQVAIVEMNLQDGFYDGLWITDTEGEFLLRTTLVDVSGNMGMGSFQRIVVRAWNPPLPSYSPPVGPQWEHLRLSDEALRPVVLDMAFAPSDSSIVYALTQNALWRSTDRGMNWVRAGYMNGHHMFPLNALHMDAIDPLTIYAGNMRSWDGGRSWFGYEGATKAVDPIQPGQVYRLTFWHAPSTVERLEASDNWGDTWRTLDIANITERLSPWVSSVAIHPANTAILYFLYGGWPGAEVYRSPDRGRTWNSVNLPADFVRIQPDPADERGLFGITDGELSYSSDAGDSWRSLRSFPATWPYWQFRTYAHSILLWSVAERSVLVSGDLGVTWSELMLPPLSAAPVPFNHTLAPFVDPRDARRMFLMMGTDGRLPVFMRTQNGGQSWEEVTFPVVDSPAGAIAFDAGGGLHVSGRTAGADAHPGVYTSDNGGMSWRWAAASVPETIPRYEYVPVFRSLLIDSHSGVRLATIPYEVQTAGGGGAGIVDGDLWRSVDAGRSWSPAGFSRYIGGYTDSPTTLVSVAGSYVMGGWMGILASNDGITWEPRHEGLPQRSGSSRPSVTTFALHPANADRMYAAQDDSLWLSADGGSSWDILVTGYFQERITELSFNPSATKLYAIAGQEIHESRDGGRTWSLLVQLERPVEPRAWTPYRLRFHPWDDRRLYVFSSDVLLTTSDAGATWQSIGETLAGRAWFNDVAVDRSNPDILYAATPWGLYRTSTERAATWVEEETQGTVPTQVELSQNYPNPFNPSTTIEYVLPDAAEVRLEIYDLTGQRVRVLVREPQAAGTYRVVWNGVNDEDHPVASGLYVGRLRAGDEIQATKMLLIR
ncbi:MAG: T9SS type A sorting domain-containing protein, partial [Gemmatimonadetes bacterium]|nr:T9SS type A sorting domain-containing protein [Gemmatimonadota bacterium]